MSLARWGKWSEKITEYRIHPEIKDFKRTSQHRNKESEDKIGQNTCPIGQVTLIAYLSEPYCTSPKRKNIFYGIT
jgi:hypothetical protein